MKCIFFVSAGKTQGMGHLMRSIVAAQSLNKDLPDITVKFVIVGELSAPCLLRGFDYEIFNTLDIHAFNSTVKVLNPDLIVLDIFRQKLNPEIIKPLTQSREDGIKIVAIDGLVGLEGLIDLVYKPSFYNKKFENQNKANVVYGWDCYLLNTGGNKSDLIKNFNGEIRILVLTGGADSYGLGKVWPKLLNELKNTRQIIIDWVVGPYSGMPTLPKERKVKFNLHVAPKGLGDLMRNTDYALSVYGVSLFELLSYEKPAVVYTDGSMNEEMNALEREGVAIVADDVGGAVTCLANLILDEKKSRALAKNAAVKLVSATGAKFSCEVKKIIFS